MKKENTTTCELPRHCPPPDGSSSKSQTQMVVLIIILYSPIQRHLNIRHKWWPQRPDPYRVDTIKLKTNKLLYASSYSNFQEIKAST
jgi:hypothetical protein